MARKVEAWRNAITRYAEEAPESLQSHPRNPKVHPKRQTDALAGAISDLGWLAPVVVNERTGRMLDGHARVALAIQRREPTVPVVYVDLDEALEAEALLTFDPIGNLASHDKEQLDILLREVSTGEAAVQEFLADLAEREKVVLPVDGPPIDAPEDRVDAVWGIIVDCEDEAQQAALLERLSTEGYRCRAVM